MNTKISKSEIAAGEKIASFSVPGLAFGLSSAMVMAFGLNNPATSGNRVIAKNQNSNSVVMAGLRERSCEIMTGTTCSVLLTPDQARFFCVRDKAQKKHTRKTSLQGGRMSFHYAIPAFTGSNLSTLAKGGAA